MSKARGLSSRKAKTRVEPVRQSLVGVPVVNLLLDPKVDTFGSPPTVVLEEVGRNRVVSASGVIVLDTRSMEVEWVRAVIQRSQRAIPAKLPKKGAEALLLPNPGDPTQILYQFVDDSLNTRDCRIKGAIEGLDNRLLVYAKIRRKGSAKQFLSQTCLQFEAIGPRGNPVQPGVFIKEHTVSFPRGKMGGVLQKAKSATLGLLESCIGAATLPTAGIREVAAFIYPDQNSANGPGDPPAGAKRIAYKSLMSDYKFKQDLYDGVYTDNRVPGVRSGQGNFLVVWAKFDGDANWYRALNTQNGLQFFGDP